MLKHEEEQFLNDLYAKYAHTLIIYSHSMLLQIPDSFSVAQECMQETFEKAIAQRKTLCRHEAPLLWLKKTCRNITSSKRRKILNRARIHGWKASEDIIGNTADPYDCIEEWALRQDTGDIKRLLLESLTNEERDVYHAYYEENRSLKDAAAVLGISENAVRGAISRIKAKLAKSMSATG